MRLLPRVGISRRGNPYVGWGPIGGSVSTRRAGSGIAAFVALGLAVIAFATPGILLIMLFTSESFMTAEGNYFYQALILSAALWVALVVGLVVVAARRDRT
jgi:hypothetical protein